MAEMETTERVRNKAGSVIMAIVAGLYAYSTVVVEYQLYRFDDVLSGFRAPLYAVLALGCLFTLSKGAGRLGERCLGILMWVPPVVLALMTRLGGAQVGAEMLAMLSLTIFSVPLLAPGRWSLWQVFRPFNELPAVPPAYPPTSIVIDAKK